MSLKTFEKLIPIRYISCCNKSSSTENFFLFI